jgi:hypothetical protein
MYKNASDNTTVGYGFHFKLTNPRAFPKSLSMIVEAPWCVPNTVIRRDLLTPTVYEEIRRYSSQCGTRFSFYPNDLVVNFRAQLDNRPLPRHLPNDLPAGFILEF